MPAFRHRIRALAVGIGAFALVAVAAGGTFAASNPATLYACYDAYGNVRMSDTAQCKLSGGGRLVYWSTAGVPGPTGATGATGPTGPTGPKGDTGSGAFTRRMAAPRSVVYPGPTLVPVTSGPGYEVMLDCYLSQPGLVLRVPGDSAEALDVKAVEVIGAVTSSVSFDLDVGFITTLDLRGRVDVQVVNSIGGAHVVADFLALDAQGGCVYAVTS